MDELLSASDVSQGSVTLALRFDQEVTKQKRPAFLEFFAGSGLVAYGLKNSFRAVWANDLDPKKAAVYTANHDAKHFACKSISDVRGTDLPQAPMAWASFPCQDLSLAGFAGGIHASRSGLVWEWLRIIDEMPIRPTVLVAENVVGLVSTDNGAHYRTLHKALTARGYRVGAVLIDAIRWTPQSRPRIFIVAVDAKANVPLSLVGSNPTWLHSAAIRKVAEGLDGWVWWDAVAPTPRTETLSDIVQWDVPFDEPDSQLRNINLISPRHRAMLDAIPKSERIVVPGYKRTRNGSQVLELRFDDVAGCLRTPEGGSSRQVIIIRTRGKLHSRLLTVREAARLMGAPESYRIPGTYNDGYKAMGDAVAAPVAQWLGKTFLAPLVKANAPHT